MRWWELESGAELGMDLAMAKASESVRVRARPRAMRTATPPARVMKG
jgi:hypothetical protein